MIDHIRQAPALLASAVPPPSPSAGADGFGEALSSALSPAHPARPERSASPADAPPAGARQALERPRTDDDEASAPRAREKRRQEASVPADGAARDEASAPAEGVARDDRTAAGSAGPNAAAAHAGGGRPRAAVRQETPDAKAGRRDTAPPPAGTNAAAASATATAGGAGRAIADSAANVLSAMRARPGAPGAGTPANVAAPPADEPEHSAASTAADAAPGEPQADVDQAPVGQPASPAMPIPLATIAQPAARADARATRADASTDPATPAGAPRLPGASGSASPAAATALARSTPEAAQAALDAPALAAGHRTDAAPGAAAAPAAPAVAHASDHARARPAHAATPAVPAGDGVPAAAASPALPPALSERAARPADTRLAGDDSPATVHALPTAGAPAPAFATITSARSDLPTAQFTLPTPIDDPAFPGALAGQVDQIVMQSLDAAEILVTPRDMGPIRIELALSGESASVAFSATQPETRQAIEQSLPTLRAMLAEHGITLGDARVGHGNDGRRATDGRPQQTNAGGTTTGGASAGRGEGAASSITPRAVRARAGLLDLYA